MHMGCQVAEQALFEGFPKQKQKTKTKQQKINKKKQIGE